MFGKPMKRKHTAREIKSIITESSIKMKTFHLELRTVKKIYGIPNTQKRKNISIKLSETKRRKKKRRKKAEKPVTRNHRFCSYVEQHERKKIGIFVRRKQHEKPKKCIVRRKINHKR